MKQKEEKLFFYLIALFLFIATGIVAVGTLYYHHEAKSQKKRTFQNLEAIADFKVREIMLWRKERLSDAKILLSNPFIHDNLKSISSNKGKRNGVKSLSQYMDKVSKEYSYREWVVFDSNLKPILSSSNNLHTEIEHQPWFTENIWSGPFFSDLHFEDHGTISMDLVIPIVRGDTKFLVLFFIDPSDYLYPLIQTWPGASATGETILVEKSGAEILFLNDLRNKGDMALNFRTPYIEDLPAVKAVNKISTSMEGRDYLRIPVLAVTRHIEGTPWGLVTKINVEEVLSPLRGRLIFVVISSLLLMSASGIAIIFLWQRQRSSIRLSESEKYKEIAEQLQTLSSLQTAILDNAGFTIISVTTEGLITSFNKAAEKMLGYSAQEMIGKKSPQVFHDIEEIKERAAIFSRELDQNIEPGFEVFVAKARLNLPNEYEWTYIRKDGSTFPGLLTITALRDDAGKITGFLGLAADLTSLKKAKKSLEDSLSFNEAIIESSPYGILVYDSSGNCILANEAIGRIIGATRNQVLSQNFRTISSWQETGLRDKAEESLRMGEAGEIETYITTTFGKRTWLNVIFVPVVVSGEKHLLAMVHDVTEKRKTEEEYKTILATTMDSFWTADTKGRFIDVNDAYCNLTGYSREEVLSMNIPDVEAAEKPEETVKHIEKVISQGYDRFESKHRCKNGSIVDLDISANFLNIEGGRFYVFLRDITEQNIAKRALMEARDGAEKANRAKSEFLANMSHEIRTPMTSILGMAELLTETKLNKEQEEYLMRLRNSGDALVSIINDILDLSKIEAGQVELENIDFNIKRELEKVISIFQMKADRKKIKILYNISPLLPPSFVGDPVRLRQVLVNIIGNAVKFTDSGSITIKAVPDGWGKDIDNCCLHLSVTDTGIGLEPEKLEHIFEEFVQSDASTTRLYGGTGLGLTISRKLIKLMNGKIWAESESGKGSTFHMLFEFKKGGNLVEAGHDMEGEEPVPVSEVPFKVLLAEDSEDNRLLVKTFLKGTANSIDMAENGEIAFEMFLASQYDLVLMDMQMPVMDGYEATRIIRKWEEDQCLERTPIVAFTAHALKEEVEQCLRVGCDGHIAKPIRKKSLMAIISRYGALKDQVHS